MSLGNLRGSSSQIVDGHGDAGLTIYAGEGDVPPMRSEFGLSGRAGGTA